MSRAWCQPDFQLARTGGAEGQAPAPSTLAGMEFWCGTLLMGGASAGSAPRPESAVETPPVPGNTKTQGWAG